MESNGGAAERRAMLTILTENPAFRAVAENTLERLTGAAQTLKARKGEVIYEEGHAWDRLGFVIDGSVAMVVTGEGRRNHLYEQIFAGSFFGVSAVIDGEPEMARTLVVSREASYAWIPRDTVLEICRSDGRLALALGTVVAQRLRRVTSVLAAQVSLTTEERLARFLLNFAEGVEMAPASAPLGLMTQSQIAAAAGTVKEVAARAIAELERQNALRRERGHIVYLNRSKLMHAGRMTGGPEAATK